MIEDLPAFIAGAEMVNTVGKALTERLQEGASEADDSVGAAQLGPT
jgi:hypothetical protein